MTFNHNNEGITINYKNKNIILNDLAVAEGLLTDDELLKYSEIILKFDQRLGKISTVELKPSDLKIGVTKELKDIHNPLPFYKYISKKDYETFYSKGHFQLCTSKYYRDIERKESKDGFEGYNISVLQVNNSHIPITLFRCNNYLILCGSSVKSAEYMYDKFGEVEMEIQDSELFAKNIAKSIGALNYTIANVEYNNAKIAKSKHINIEQFSPQDFIHKEEIIELILSTSLYPSLYVKPKMFQQENELRIVFEIPNDYPTCYNFQDVTLLNHINFNL
jgi:hypothetical protein